MNILVTGAAGFIGGHLCKYLSSQHRVYGLYHDAPPRSVVWDSRKGDVTDLDRMLELVVNLEIDQVYHLAARSIVRNCCHDPLGCFRVNILGTATVLEACRQSGRVRGIMCMESDKSYGPGLVPYRESQPLQPAGIYEASKASAGHVASSYYKNYGVPVFSVRSANVYGPCDPNSSRLIPNTVLRLRKGLPPQVTPGADDFLREFIHVDDFTYIVERLMEVSPWGEAINVGSGITATVSQVVELICKAMDKPYQLETAQKQNNLVEIPKQWLDLTKLHTLLSDLRKPIELEQGLRGLVC